MNSGMDLKTENREVLVFVDIEVGRTGEFGEVREIGYISESGVRESFVKGDLWATFTISFRKDFSVYNTVYLVAHNGLRFDFMYLYHRFASMGLHSNLRLCDSLEVLIDAVRVDSYDLLHVYHSVFKHRPRGLHTAIGDAVFLAQVCEKLNLYSTLKSRSISFSEAGTLYRVWVLEKRLIHNSILARKRKALREKSTLKKTVDEKRFGGTMKGGEWRKPNTGSSGKSVMKSPFSV